MDVLQVRLSTLRNGPVERHERLADPAAELGELPFALAWLDLEFIVGRDAGEGVRARGVIRGRADGECRRCLSPTPVSIAADFDALFRPAAEVTPGEEGVWPLDPDSGWVDLREPIREELWVSAPEYVECGPGCRGLCPRCGVRLEEEACTCPPPEPDPRWAALRALGRDRG